MRSGKLGGRFGGSRLGGSDSFSPLGDINPMDGVSNLADVMLVFACGLMVALIINWNVDVATQTKVEVDVGEEISEMEGLDNNDASILEGSQYHEFGVVYQDPETGKLYMVTDGG